MFYPTSMPLLTGLALFVAAGANSVIGQMLKSLFRSRETETGAGGRFGAADVLMILALMSTLGLSIWFLANRAVGRLDGTAVARSGAVAAPLAQTSP